MDSILRKLATALQSNPTLLATVVVGLCLVVNEITGELDAAKQTDARIVAALELSNITQQQISKRLTSIENQSQKQFTLIRELRTDINKNDKQIMILQVNDQQMWATIDDIRKYVPSSISALEARMVAVEKDVTRIEGKHNGKAN